jgi:hypothetical protein
MIVQKPILDCVLRGKMTTEEAETYARENGFRPFAAKPEPSIFDPMTAASWTPLQAIVWIATRDINHVREVAEEFRKAWLFWKAVKVDDPDPIAVVSGKVCHGWRLDMMKPARFREAAAGCPAIYGARDELWDQLINGAILATGFELAADGGAKVGKRVTIPSADWIDLHFPGDDRIKWASRSVFFHPTLPGLHARMLQEDTSFDGPDRVRSETGVAYFAVRILRTDILEQWKEPGTATIEFPGRPSLKEAIKQKMRERHAAGAMWPRTATSTRRRAYDSGERARSCLAKCFPEGMPSEAEVPNSELVRRVQAKHGELFRGPAPTRKTILTHAGRKNHN